MRRSWWAILLAVVLGGVLLLGAPDDDGPPLSPSGTGPLGTRALVLFLESLGAEVEVSRATPGPDDDVALVLADDLGDDRRDALVDWVADGGRLVVADPSSPLTGLAPAPIGPLDSLDTSCDIPALADVEEVDPVGGLVFELRPQVDGCFLADDGSAFVAVADAGAGTVVAIGGAGGFTNGTIDSADNGLLAAALLAPSSGTRVAFVQPPLPGDGEEGLFDLVGDGVRAALWQLVVAFAIYALWRARRLGRPVLEPQPVELAASELVVAVGNLLQQAGRSDQAGGVLRDDVRRRLAERLGLSSSMPPEVVAEVAAERTGIPVERLRAVLVPGPVAGDDGLVRLATEAETLRAEVVHG